MDGIGLKLLHHPLLLSQQVHQQRFRVEVQQLRLEPVLHYGIPVSQMVAHAGTTLE